MVDVDDPSAHKSEVTHWREERKTKYHAMSAFFVQQPLEIVGLSTKFLAFILTRTEVCPETRSLIHVTVSFDL
jgi:hypothetical protein